MNAKGKATPTSTAQWWKLIEETSFDLNAEQQAPGKVAGPNWLDDLAKAHQLELQIKTEEARTLLNELRPAIPRGPWSSVLQLLKYRLDVRESNSETLAEIKPALSQFALELSDDEQPTIARCYHLLGVLNIRLACLEEAELALSKALELIEEAPTRTWILDTFGQVLIGQGAWVEARRTLHAVGQIKERRNDHLGAAITYGNLARMELSLGDAEEARKILRATLDTHGAKLVDYSRMRLLTLLVEACIECDDVNEAATEAKVLQELVGSWQQAHYLKGYAFLALARVAHLHEDHDAAQVRLKQAKAFFTLPAQTAMVGVAEARLFPELLAQPAWLEEMKALFRQTEVVMEAELDTQLLLCDHAVKRGYLEQMRIHLDKALDLAVQSNNNLWLDRVEKQYREYDAFNYSKRVVERFSGRTAEELSKVSSEEATIIFADLVNFTPRSVQLPPDQVMQTVRSIFELSVPLLAKHKVRPISYLGDGLLAVCQGEDQGLRGARFAMDVVARSARMTAIRQALGEEWGLDLRAGVATGTVIMGAIGSHYKTEYLAIGLTTNMAARLQAAGEPREVVCAYHTAEQIAAEGSEEHLQLKGFAEPVHALRFQPTR